ncbi:MAG: hypothetical protein AAF483_11240 [Planctomycetota bacterium]
MPKSEYGDNLRDQLEMALRPEELSWQALSTLLLISTRRRLTNLDLFSADASVFSTHF